MVANPTGAAQNGFIPLPPHWLPQKGDHLIFEEKYYREDQPTTALGQDRAAPVYVRSLQDLTNGLYVELQPGQVHIFVVYPKPRVAIPTGGADINQSGPSAGNPLRVGLAGRMAAFAFRALRDPVQRMLTDFGRGAWALRWVPPRGPVHERPILLAAA